MIRRLLLPLALIGLVAVCDAPAGATDLRDVITDITITTWNEKDGLPGATIMALAQDRDGYLWVGTRQGLLRFDGVRFTQWESFSRDSLPTRWVRSLLVTRGGEMWIGFGADGQIGHVVGGRLIVFRGETGRGGIATLAEDAAGVIWAGAEQGLYSFDGARWHHWGESSGVPDGAIVGLYASSDGTLYVAGSAGVFIRRRGAGRFERAGLSSDAYAGFAQGTDGTVWVTDPRVGYRPAGGTASAALSARQGRGIRMLVDRKGNLWTGTGGQGLWRTRNIAAGAATLERATSLTGLLGDGIYSLLEDRDGNIWAGTTEGLNRITPRTIEQIIDLGLVRTVDREPDGRVWVGTVDKAYAYPSTSEADGRRTELALPPDTRALAIDEHGLWLASGSGVSHVDRDGHATRFHWHGERDAGEVESVTLDRRGGLWLVTGQDGIVHWAGGDVERLALPDTVRTAQVTAVFVDHAGRAWFTFANGRIAVAPRPGTVSVLPDAAAAQHVFRTMAEDEDGRIWFGGDRRLALYDGSRMLSLETSERFPITAITAIVADERGSMWLGTPLGVVHLGRAEFERAATDRSATPRYSVYNRSDGVAGTPVAVPFNRSAIRRLDGRLWFVTTRGVTVVDPHVLEARSTGLPVAFESALVDDRRVGPGETLTLTSGTRKLEIDYTVVNLTAPLKSRFRYRLDPFDHDWVDAGTRRQAFYTNLKPGRYVFRVASTDADGASSSEAAWGLSVQPMFYQTMTFAALAGVSICLLVLGGWQLRERQLRKQFSLLIAERARLGREIHDTLLQGLVAIALQFDSIAHELAPLPKMQERFLRLRDRVEEYIREARRSIWDLHTQPPHRNLVESLRRAGEFATDGRDIAFTLQIQGTPYECPPKVEEQVVRIAQEASLNSVRHASPRRLRIDLTYDDTAVTLKVVDDGRGFDTQEARGGGHYGIRSMQERARSVGGALSLSTAPGRGTEVTAVLPVAG